MFNLFKRKKKVSPEELGDGLWQMCKMTSQQLSIDLINKTRQYMDDLSIEREVISEKDLLIFNFWVFKNALSGEPKVAERMSIRYFSEMSNPHNNENLINEMAYLGEQTEKYKKALVNSDQTKTFVISRVAIKNIFKDDHIRKDAEKTLLLLTFFQSYMNLRTRMIREFLQGFVIN